MFEKAYLPKMDLKKTVGECWGIWISELASRPLRLLLPVYIQALDSKGEGKLIIELEFDHEFKYYQSISKSEGGWNSRASQKMQGLLLQSRRGSNWENLIDEDKHFLGQKMLTSKKQSDR